MRLNVNFEHYDTHGMTPEELIENGIIDACMHQDILYLDTQFQEVTQQIDTQFSDAVIINTGVTGVKGDAEDEYRKGDVNLTKENIGLGNVDNTADIDKPISQATQAALDDKQDILTSENAGTGISITTDQQGNVIISNTNISAEWGNITGNITDQTDFIEYITNHTPQYTLIYGLPFDSDNNINLNDISYWKFVEEIPSNASDISDLQFLSGEELAEIINTKAVQFEILSQIAFEVFEPLTWWNLDGELGRIWDPSREGNSCGIYCVNHNNDTLTVQIKTESPQYLQEAIATKLSQIFGTNGIAIEDGLGTKRISLQENIVFDCGTSTLNV